MMDTDLMNDLDDLLAAAGEASPPPTGKPMPPQGPPGPPNNGMASKGVKEVLGARLRDNQMNNEVAAQKRKLEEANGPGDMLSAKSQKMDNGSDGLVDNDFNSMVNGNNVGNVGNDDHMNNVGGGQSRLLAQALMDKRPPNNQQPLQPPNQQSMMGLRSPPPNADASLPMLMSKFNELRKENRHEELKMLLDKNPKLRHYVQQRASEAGMMMDQNGMPRNPMMGRGPGPDGPGGPNGGMMDNPNFYNQPQQRGPMQPQMQRPPMGSPMGQSWPPSGPQGPSMGGYNGGTMVQPQRSIRPPPHGGQFIGDVPPNAWVQSNMNGGGPPMGGMPDGGPYYRNTMRPMLRPQNMNNHYGDFPNGNPAGNPGGQMYGQMRNFNMNSNGDAYGNTRFGSPNGVCSPMYSPNTGGSNDPMIRMNNGNFNDNSVVNNGSYNNFNDFGPGGGGGPPGGPGGPGNPVGGYNNRVRHNFMQNGGGGRPAPHGQPQMMPFNGGRMGGPGMPPQNNSMYHGGNMQQQPPQGFNNSYNNMNNVNSMMDQQQPHHQPQHLPQQQQQQQHQQAPIMNNGGGPLGGGPNSDFDFGGGNRRGGPADNNNEVMEWKTKASTTEVRKSLLAKLKNALMSQNYPNAIQTAESFESSAFNEANTLSDYQYKLANWLASIFENTGPMGTPSATALSNPGAPSSINSPPDSSTNDQISDVTTSSNPAEGVITNNHVNDPTSGSGGGGGNTLEELLTPRSVSPSTMASPNGATSMASPATSNAASTSIASSSSPSSSLSNTQMTTTTASSSSPMTSMSSSTPTMTSNSTFQHPAMPPVNPGGGGESEKQATLNGQPQQPVAPGGTSRLLPGQQQPQQQRRISGSGALNTATAGAVTTGPALPVSSISNNPQSVDSGIGLGSPRSITSASSSTLYSPKIQGTSPSLLPGSDNSPEKASSS